MLIIYLDGIQFGNHHVLAAVGVDEDGKKYVLGVRSGASENATVTTALLEDLVARGIRPTDVGCSSSMERRRYAARSPRCSAPATRYSAVATTSCGMSSATYRTRSTTRHGPPCAPPGSSRLRRACASLTRDASWLQRDCPMQQRAFEKASMRSSP